MTKQKAKNQQVQTSSVTHSLNLFTGFKIQAIVLIVIGFLIYSNSFLNQYALDDGIVILKNDYVQKGIKGIPKILKTDSYDSFYKQMNAKQQLSGGRYRPLSVVTFAIEQSLFGGIDKEKPSSLVTIVRHILNVLFYILSVVLLLYLLNTFVFKDNPLAGFFTCLIFLIHPIHTEVVSNIKSRDEILSFLFIVLTFIGLFKFITTKKTSQLFYSLFFYFLALLSKEYAVTLIILIPILLYVINNDSLKAAFIRVLPFIAVAIIYLLIRFSIVGKGATIENPDVLNNPYKFATSPEKWATRIEILNHYLRLLFYPNSLSSDYSYATIPYINFSNAKVWFAIVLHLSLVFVSIKLFFKRNIVSFALAFYLVHLFLISNLIMDIGATMGERLIYHSSFGFALIVGFYLSALLIKITNPETRKYAVVFTTLILTATLGFKVMSRNLDWKNDTTLFIADAQTVPNSALVNGNAGKAYLDLSEIKENKSKENEYIRKSIFYLSRSVKIHNTYVNGYLNLGVAYYKLKEYDSAKTQWDKVKIIYPNNPFLIRDFKLLAAVYFDKGMRAGKNNPAESIKYLEKATEIEPSNADYWYNLGGASFMTHDFEKAINAWTISLQLNPNNEDAKRGLAALQSVFPK